MDAAALIRQARHHAGFTQGDLAQRAGTSQPTVAAYEAGSKSPSVRTLNKLIRACGFHLEPQLVASHLAQGSLLDEIRQHSKELRDIARSLHIHNLRIFGSTARGDESDDSDVDFLVDFNITEYGVTPLARFAIDGENLIGRKVDVTTVELLADEIRTRVEKEAVPL